VGGDHIAPGGGIDVVDFSEGERAGVFGGYFLRVYVGTELLLAGDADFGVAMRKGIGLMTMWMSS